MTFFGAMNPSRQTNPEAVGEYLEKQRETHPDRHTHPLSVLADSIPWGVLPEVDKRASLGTVTAELYRRELEERTDKYAKAALRDIDAGKGVQGFDPGGE